MKKMSLLASSIVFIMGWAYASKEVGCKCEDKTVQYPECGMCGTEAGYMDLNEDGTAVACYCDNKIKSSEKSCAKACKLHGGWTGDIEHQ